MSEASYGGRLSVSSLPDFSVSCFSNKPFEVAEDAVILEAKMRKDDRASIRYGQAEYDL